MMSLLDRSRFYVVFFVTCLTVFAFGLNVKAGDKGGGSSDGGGGGVGVIDVAGHLRLLDMARKDQLPIYPFTQALYKKKYRASGNMVSSRPVAVDPKSFFACAAEKLAAQKDPFLQLVATLNYAPRVYETELPLLNKAGESVQIFYRDSSDWVSSITPLSWDVLLSPSVPAEMQRPIASFAIEKINRLSLAQEILLVSRPLYAQLPASPEQNDQCALQLHELLRYISASGHGERPSPPFLQKPLTTVQIENMVAWIMSGRQVHLLNPTLGFTALLKIRETNSGKITTEQIESVQKEIDPTGAKFADEIDMTAEEFFVLLENIQIVDQNVQLIEGAIHSIQSRSLPWSAPARELREQDEMLGDDEVDINSYF